MIHSSGAFWGISSLNLQKWAESDYFATTVFRYCPISEWCRMDETGKMSLAGPHAKTLTGVWVCVPVPQTVFCCVAGCQNVFHKVCVEASK